MTRRNLEGNKDVKAPAITRLYLVEEVELLFLYALVSIR